MIEYTFFYRERPNREHGPILGQKLENNYFQIENNAGPPNLKKQRTWAGWVKEIENIFFRFDNFTDYLNNYKV